MLRRVIARSTITSRSLQCAPIDPYERALTACSVRFSSSSPSSSPSTTTSTPRPLVTGWDAKWRLLQRHMARLSRLEEYDAHNLLSPSLSGVHHGLLHATLNAPQTVDLNLYEFLEAAQDATKLVLGDVNSLAFAAFANGQSDASNGAIIERMEAYCTPQCFQQLVRSVKNTTARGLTIETINVQVDRTFLYKAAYAQLTEQEFADELRGMHLKPLRTRERYEDSTLERLQLLVEVHTCERQRHSCRRKHEQNVLDQHCVYLLLFTSRVTTLEELDWRLASIALRTKGKQHKISRTSWTGEATK